MKSNGFILIVLVMALVTMACGFSINLRDDDLKTGPTVTEDLFVERPDEGVLTEVELNFGAGRLYLEPGAEDGLIEGTATYNVPDLKPEIIIGNTIELSTGNLELDGIPNLSGDIKNEWDLKLNTDPINLMISAGAYQGFMELGGLALQNLKVTDGAADVDLKFSEPNLTEMDQFSYQTGASNVELTGLANANFKSMSFTCGAGDYTLDFSGELQQAASVDINAGMGSLTIVIPEGVNANVFVSGGLNDVNRSGAWEKNNDEYRLDGSGPVLTIDVSMSAGSLNLRTR